jgi:addiction module HigA family antidote
MDDSNGTNAAAGLYTTSCCIVICVVTAKPPSYVVPPDGALVFERMRRAPVHPGPVFREQFREPLEVSQRQAAFRLGISVNYLNQIENEKSPVSPDVAVRLSALTRVSAQFWMRLQANHDLWHAVRAARRRTRVIPGKSFEAEVRAFRRAEGVGPLPKARTPRR